MDGLSVGGATMCCTPVEIGADAPPSPSPTPAPSPTAGDQEPRARAADAPLAISAWRDPTTQSIVVHYGQTVKEDSDQQATMQANGAWIVKQKERPPMCVL